MLDWPWRRFERFYTAFVVRGVIERMERQRDAIIAALHANSVYDEHKEARRDEAIENIEQSFDEAQAKIIAFAEGREDPDDDYDLNNPFWQAAERGAKKLDAILAGEDPEQVTAGDIVEGERAAEDVRMMLATDQA